MSDTHTLRLGPLSFRTVAGAGPTEAVGNAIEVVGSALVSADPAPKPFTLQIPVGFSGRAAREEGVLARQQVRALLNNAEARMQGLYFSWSIDPELDAWLIVGGGDLDASADSVALGEWTLTLRDCFVAGRRRTHREAVVVTTALDRRLATVPRDSFGTIRRDGDFAARPVRTLLALPAGASDVLFPNNLPQLQTRATMHTATNVAAGLDVGAVTHFERPDPTDISADVRIRDRRNTDEETWADVYGADQPLTAGDVPVLENGFCRIEWSSGTLRLLTAAAPWEERGRVPIGTLFSAHVAGWTPDRAAVAVVAYDDAGQRVVLLLTLARGWYGPQIELYTPGAQLRYVEASGRSAVVRVPALPVDTTSTSNPVLPGGAQFTTDNWLHLTHDGFADVFAVNATHAISWGNETGTYGAPRSWLQLSSPHWVGVRISLRVPVRTHYQDSFTVDSHALYTFTGGAVTIGGGRLVPLTASETTATLDDEVGMDVAAALAFRTGATVTGSWRMRVIIRRSDDGFIAGEYSGGGALSIVRNRSGVETVLATTPAPAAAPNASDTLYVLTEGSLISCQLGLARVEHRLDGVDNVTFAAGRGQIGFALRSAVGSYLTSLQGYSGEDSTRMLGQSVLLDARGAPTLIARN